MLYSKLKREKKFLIIIVAFILFSYLSYATESLKDSLHTAIVLADRGLVVSKREVIKIHNNEDISSLLSRVSGISLSDYGSRAGLKSVSIRGMGSANTAVYIDGVRVGNVQSGQPDLGLIDPTVFSSMIVDYAQNSLSFITARPQFTDNNRFNASVQLLGGSFYTYLPALKFNYKISNNLSAKANVSVQSSKGSFPYTSAENVIVNRVNNDIFKANSGLDLFGDLYSGKWHAKAFYSNAQRGTPGSLTYLDADSRQKDKNAFIQFSLDNRFTKYYRLLLSSKVALDNLDYSYSYANYFYRQREAQLNTSHIFRIADWWKASFTADYTFSALNSKENEADYYNAKRNSIHNSLSTSFYINKLTLNFVLLSDVYIDKGYETKNCFSPSFDFHYQLNKNLKLAAFTRRAYRVPTFNDLYFPGMSSTELKPEDSWLNDIGIDYQKDLNQKYRITAALSTFYYALSNKITTMPDPNDPTGWTWLPYNIGTVHNTGFNLNFLFERYSGRFRYSFKADYAFQNALDMADKTQVPYVPKHTVTSAISAAYQSWEIILSGNAKIGRQDSQGKMPSFCIVDVTLKKKIGQSLTFLLKSCNVLNSQYEIVRYYPMPGLSIIAGLEFTYPTSKAQKRKLQQK